MALVTFWRSFCRDFNCPVALFDASIAIWSLVFAMGQDVEKIVGDVRRDLIKLVPRPAERPTEGVRFNAMIRQSDVLVSRKSADPRPSTRCLTRFWAVALFGTEADGLKPEIEQMLPFFGGQVVLERIFRTLESQMTTQLRKFARAIQLTNR